LKISNERQTAGNFPQFVDTLKDCQALKDGVAEIGFSCYFRILKKNLAGKPGLFKKSRLGESGMRKISPCNEFRVSGIGPSGEFSSMKIANFLNFCRGKETGPGKNTSLKSKSSLLNLSCRAWSKAFLCFSGIKE